MTPRNRRVLTDPRDTELGPPLRVVGRRLRLRDGVLFATRTLWPALVATAVLLSAGWLWPIERLWWWAGAPLLLWLLAVLGYGLIRPLPLLAVARRIDVMLGLKERLSTALELATGNAQGELVERQWTDALSAAERLNPRRDVKLTVDRRSLKWAGLAAVAIVILAVVPNPMDAVLERRAAVREATQAQAEEIEELREELHAETTPTSEEREELLRRLAELARKLRENRGTQEEALADISEAEEALYRQLDPQAGAKRAALQSLTNQLTQLAARRTDAHQQTNKPTNQQTNSPQETLNQLAEALASLNPTQRAGLAQQLDQLAAQIATTDADPSTSSGQGLADALSALADAARRGDAQAGTQAAQAVQAALTHAQRDQDLQAAIARALAELQDSRQAVAQAGQGSRGAGEQASGQGQGQGQGQGSGQGQGGQPGGGGGTNARQLPPGSRVGRAGDPSGPARSPDVGELNEVYAPRVPGEAGDIDFIQGQQGSEGETQTRQEQLLLPGRRGRATVPYTEVLPAYREAAGAALEREYIPPGLREYVKEYFSRLDPSGQQTTP